MYDQEEDTFALFRSVTEEITIDAIDRKLLSEVQRDATLTYEQLSERVGASPSAVQRRIAKLKSSRIIRGVHAIVNAAAVGNPLTFLVGLEIERKRPDLYGSLQRWILARDSIQQAYNVTGSFDFMITVTAPTLNAYDLLMGEMIEANPNIRKYTTMVVLQTLKQETAIPILPAA
jgi:DNA-binding Lrp family transcriptional regulator